VSGTTSVVPARIYFPLRAGFSRRQKTTKRVFFSASSARRFHRSDRSKALFEQGTGQVAKYEERPSRRRPIWPRM